MCTAVLIGWDPAPPPRISLGSYTRGCWSAKIDDITLWPPDIYDTTHLTQVHSKICMFFKGNVVVGNFGKTCVSWMRKTVSRDLEVQFIRFGTSTMYRKNVQCKLWLIFSNLGDPSRCIITSAVHIYDPSYTQLKNRQSVFMERYFKPFNEPMNRFLQPYGFLKFC
jgi:hypothetical protein